MHSVATFADVLKFDPSQRRDARGRWTGSGGGEDPPPVGPRIGFIGADGKEHVGRKSGGLGGYSEDHTDTARRLLGKEYATALSQAQAREGDYPNAIRLMLEQGAIRYWVRRGELALNFHAGHPKTVAQAIKFLHDNFQDGDRIYLDVEHGDTTLGKFFDSLGEANRVIRQQGEYRAQKFDPSQRRDAKGRWTDTGAPSLEERYPVEPSAGGFMVRKPGGGGIFVGQDKKGWLIGGSSARYPTKEDAILDARLRAADSEPKPKPPFKSSTAEEAEQLIAEAKANGQRVLFHSGDASQAADLAKGIQPQMGAWVQEVLAGATDDEEGIRQIEEDPANEIAFYSETPEWVSMKASRVIEGRHVTEITPEELEQHGHLSIVVVDPDDEDLMTSDENQMVYRGGSEEARREAIPVGVEPGDIYTRTEYVPDATLTGKELLRFLNRNYPEANLLKGTLSVFKQEHKFGNTQIHIDPTSSAAATLNAARDRIADTDLMADGKDVDPNHVTVRFGLLNDDLDSLRSYIARQQPFEARVIGIELFPASEHSDGAVPVVARIASPELHAIEEEIGQYADFKEKSFPVYKPHCTLAYCKPEAAPDYAELYVDGSFIVQNITISHASGVMETIPFGMAQKREWDESKHRRQPKGSEHAGEFMAVHHGPKDALDSLLNKEKNVDIDRNDVRTFLELAAEQGEDPNLSELHVEGTEMFGGRGLGIKREDMPQIPRDHRQQFMDEMVKEGVVIERVEVSPADLKPTQKEISARRVGQMIERYDKGKEWNPPLVSQDGRLLDGHHHWGLMASLMLELPDVKMPVYRLRMGTRKALAFMHAYMKKHGLQRQSMTSMKADPISGRYVTPFVSFDKQGDEQLRMIASLNSSRLATWGFTAEAEVLGMARYKLTAVLDGRTSKFCRFVANGRIFDVPDARRKVIEALNVQNPDDLRTVQPWPKQDKASMAMYRAMSNEELVERGLHIPPYHPHCRTILRHVKSSIGKAKEPPVETLPDDVAVFQPVTAADLKELGIDATPEQVAEWNAHIGMSPTELLSKLTSMPPQEVMTKGKGVGSRPIRFDDQGEGNIGVHARGETPKGVEFQVGAILDPFTGNYYLSEAELIKGSPQAELEFVKNLLSEMVEATLASAAELFVVNVAGNAAYYAKLGFLPDGIEWDAIRLHALEELTTGSLTGVMASLSELDRKLVTQLLQDKSPEALVALVELPFSYGGRTLAEWILGDTTGMWALDVGDSAVMQQVKGYLS